MPVIAFADGIVVAPSQVTIQFAGEFGQVLKILQSDEDALVLEVQLTDELDQGNPPDPPPPTPHPKPKTQNPKPKTQNPEPEPCLYAERSTPKQVMGWVRISLGVRSRGVRPLEACRRAT